MELGNSKLKVLAALAETRGVVQDAAKLAGVTKQYVYDIIGRLKKRGVKLRAYPFLSALGRVFVAFCTYVPPDNGLLALRLHIYRFDGGSTMVGVYVVPHSHQELLPSIRLQEAIVEEVKDVLFAVPRYGVDQLETSGSNRLPQLPRVQLDDDDVALLKHLYEDLTANITSALPSASKSRLSYHYRVHVRKLLQVFVDYHPQWMHARPLIFAEVRAPSEEWLAALLKARETYAIMPRIGSYTAYALIDADDAYDLVKRIAVAKERGFFPLNVKLIGYVDPEKSSKPKIPDVFLRALTSET